MMHPLAILISDCHLSVRPPRVRAQEKKWLEAQARPWKELRKAATTLQVPILCAGDLFDRWDSPAELINWALDILPDGMICIPGQHDMPYHEPSQIHRSAYGTMVKAGKIIDLSDSPSAYIDKSERLRIIGFPWGRELSPTSPEKNVTNIAIIHKYIWRGNHKYPDAPLASHTSNLKTDLEGFDVALFGDNHKPFVTKIGKVRVYNHGNMQRRTIDEASRVPEYGVLWSNNTVERVPFQSAGYDLISDQTETTLEEDKDAIQGFVRELKHSTETRFDFREAVVRYIDEHKPSRAVVRILRNAIDLPRPQTTKIQNQVPYGDAKITIIDDMTKQGQQDIQMGRDAAY